jgi:hypothetical protein
MSMVIVIIINNIRPSMMSSVMGISDNNGCCTMRLLIHWLGVNNLGLGMNDLGLLVWITNRLLLDHNRLNHWLHHWLLHHWLDICLLRGILLLHRRILLLLILLGWILLLLHGIPLRGVLLLLHNRLLNNRLSINYLFFNDFNVLCLK